VIKSLFKSSVVVTGVMLLLGSSMTAVSYPPFLRVAAKYGAKDCTFCHTQPEGGEGWNDRGNWLRAEKDRRKAEKVDANWLADYKADSAAAAPAAAPGKENGSAKMSAEEKSKLMELLNKSMDETLKAVKGLSDAQWTYKAAPDRWSIGEVSEHILFFDPFLLSLVDRVTASPVNPAWAEQTQGKSEQMMSAVLNRSVKVKAPEPAVPKGNLSRADFLKQFPEVRAKTIKLVQDNDQAIKEHTFNHPNLGPMNGYHWLLLIPLHNMRHNLQIEEVKMSESYPKK
jgi:hypothetical protein